MKAPVELFCFINNFLEWSISLCHYKSRKLETRNYATKRKELNFGNLIRN